MIETIFDYIGAAFFLIVAIVIGTKILKIRYGKRR